MGTDIEDKSERLVELSEKGFSLKEIADELDKPLEDIQKHIMGDPEMSKRLKTLALESKAFRMFEEGEKPEDMVKSGFCEADKAEVLFQKYRSIISEGKKSKRSMQDKLATQIGLLGSRLSQLEIKIMDSTLLPKTFQCPSCGHEDKYAVALICRRCENVNLHVPDPQIDVTSRSRPLLDHLTSDPEKKEENDEE